MQSGHQLARKRHGRLVRRYGLKLAAIVCIVLATVKVVWAEVRAPYEEYKAAARQLQASIESTYSTTRGYATGMAALTALQSSTSNPFGRGTIHLRKAREAPAPGSFDYVLLASTRGAPTAGEPAQFRWLTSDSAPLRGDEVAVHYALIFYGPKPRPYLKDIAAQEFAGAGVAGECLHHNGSCL